MAKLLQLQSSLLNYTVPPDESVFTQDSTTHEVVVVVFRKICDDSGILEWVNRITTENLPAQRNIQVFCSPV